MKKVTIQEVAKELNLSRNTVAKALNNSDTVAYETRYVVIKKAYEMGYSKVSPLMLSEFKIKGRLEKVETIAVLARRELSTFSNRIIMGISDELNKNNCKLQLNFISEEDEKDLILPLDMQCDISGIIMLSVFSEQYIELLRKREVPIVFLDAPEDASYMLQVGDVILFEGYHSTRKITNQLLEQGIRKIAFIGDVSSSKMVMDRYHGYRYALGMAHIKVGQEFHIINHIKHHYMTQTEIDLSINQLSHLPEAFVCANDDIAKEVYIWLNNNGINVPEEVCVTGFYNKEEAKLLLPPLTSVCVASQRMGARIVQQLMWRMQNNTMPHEFIYVETEVILRESSQKRKAKACITV